MSEISNKNVTNCSSLPIGSRKLHNLDFKTLDEISNYIKQNTEINFVKYDKLYLTGGSLRFVGVYIINHFENIHLGSSIHNLCLKTDILLNIIEQNNNSMNLNNKIHPASLNILKAVINIFKPTNIVISSFALKEGIKSEILKINESNSNYIKNFDISEIAQRQQIDQWNFY